MSSQSSLYNPTERTLAATGDGFSVPRLTTAGRTAIALTPSDKGMMVYDTTLTTLCLWNGTAWEFIGDNSNGWVSVKDFGAQGDGVTNDSPSVQSAINYINSLGGGTVFFPVGTYFLDSQINLCNNLVMYGYGAKIKVGTSFAAINAPLFKNFAGTVFNVPGAILATKNISFYGFEFDGQSVGIPGASIPNANMRGVMICIGGWTAGSGITNFTVKDCYFHDFAGTGVMAWASSSILISNNRFLNFFSNVGLSQGSGLGLYDPTGAIVSDNTFNHTSTGYSWHGMVILDWITSSNNVTVNGNVITNMNYGDGISCEGNTGNNLYNGVFTANVIKNCYGQGIGVDNCVSVTVSDNMIESVGGPGILFTQTEDAVITGNTITTSGLGGIVTRSSQRAIISNNKIKDITYFDVNFRGEGISILTAYAGSELFTITGNLIINTAGSGIFASSYNCLINSNEVYNAATNAAIAITLRAGIVAGDQGNVVSNYINSTGNTPYAISSGSSNFPSIDSNRFFGTFTTAYYRISYRAALYVNLNASIEDARYDTVTNTFIGRFNGVPAGFWYRGDTMYETLPSSAGYIGQVNVANGANWKTFGLIS